MAAERTPIQALLRFLPVLVLVGAVVFLLASRAVDTWDGRVVGAAREPGDDTRTCQVAIIADDGSRRVVTWPVSILAEIDPTLPLTLTPMPRPADQDPRTQKHLFQLHFLVEDRTGAMRAVPTTSPEAVGVSVLVALGLLAMRNMYVSGSPIDIRPRPAVLPAPLPRSGQVVPPHTKVARNPPPPPKGFRGRRGRS